MRIRVTTTTPGYTSLIGKSAQKAAKGNLVDLPWCFKGTVGDGWESLNPGQWAVAVVKAPTGEVVMDCEGAYPYVDSADGKTKWSNATTASYLFDRQGTLDFWRKWTAVLVACHATGKSLYGYPAFPGPQGIDVSVKWPDGRDRVPENVAFLMTEKALCGRHYAAPMIDAYIDATTEDFDAKVDAQLARCASVGLAPKIVLLSAFYIGKQTQGPAASFVGADLVGYMAKSARDHGLEPCFFNPAYDAAVDAIAKAAVDL